MDFDTLLHWTAALVWSIAQASDMGGDRRAYLTGVMTQGAGRRRFSRTRMDLQPAISV